MPRLLALLALLVPADAPAANAVAGIWVLQQVGSVEELRRLTPRVLDPALATPHVQGFSLRVPWRAIEGDLALLDAGLDLARKHDVAFSVRFMAGRHVPARVVPDGSPFYTTARAERVPAPFDAEGKPNAVFEAAYEAQVARLAGWCRAHGVRLLHLPWYGQEWAELNHGREVRTLPGYSFDAWLEAHRRLIDIGLRHAGDDLAVEFPLSGHGPLVEASAALAEHAVKAAGPDSPRIYLQANGWGPRGEWGAPDPAIEAAMDRVWAQPFRRGLQMIQPQDYDWPACFARLRDVKATYAEVYAPSFTMPRREALAAEVARFAAGR